MVNGFEASLARYIKKVYPRFGLRPSDVILASYPKSGNTWFRFIWANMVNIIEGDGSPVDFHQLMYEFGSEYDLHKYGTLEPDCLPRLVKTHRLYQERVFGGNRSVYLYRHPGDVSVSYYEYLKAERASSVRTETLSQFLRDDTHGVSAWCRHVEAWLKEADAVVSYAALKTDAAQAVRRSLDALALEGIDGIDDAVIEQAVQRSAFKQMQALEAERGRPDQDDFEDGYRFVRRGQQGEWQERLTSDDVAYMKHTLQRWGLGQLVDWAD